MLPTNTTEQPACPGATELLRIPHLPQSFRGEIQKSLLLSVVLGRRAFVPQKQEGYVSFICN